MVVKSPLRVMVVGDSMSQGREGDWTWRYRIWDWFRQNDVAVRFIGPYKGTVEPEVAPNPRQANYDNSGDESSCGPKASGGYARGVNPDFESEHFALWGRAAAVSREEVGDVVKKHPTDLMLVMLGFNDMGWFYSDWEGTLESIGILINNARGANPDLKFAIANVPHRSFLSGREDLVSNTNLYNSRLPHLLSEKSTESSPVHLVDVAKHYSCGLGGCPAATDGLHPNALGEYQIAYAFAETLQGKLNIGTRPLIVPPEGDPALVRDLQIPSNFTVSSSDDGITALWDPGQFEQATESSSRRISTVLTSRTVYGAYGYDLKVSVDEGRNGLFELTTEVNRWDSQSTMDEGQYSVSVRATGGDVIKGEWTSTKTARAQPSRVFHPTETN